ncbi:MAG TPA: class I SAM-dependent methyltransferase [Longimicrobiaceae bacterium]|nr:class I SAM-dependent methyltransferase [Longimicrobiaceae bacterium]
MSGPAPRPAPSPAELRAWLGEIDVYLFDQILKGRFVPGMRLLDAGCGRGRNLRYLLGAGFEVYGVDRDPAAVEAARRLAGELRPGLPADRFRAEPVERTSFPDAAFDAVLSSAVLHFARDPDHFAAMLAEAWRVLRPGGIFFARLASDIGIEDRVRSLGGRRFALPDGTERFLVDEAMLRDAAARLGAESLEPLRTVNVDGLRCMTTWCLRRAGQPSPDRPSPAAPPPSDR